MSRLVHHVLTLLAAFAHTILTFVASCYTSIRNYIDGPPRDLHGEVALITGAGRGIGRELALQLAVRHGVHRLILWDIDIEACEETATLVKRQGGGEVKAFECDVSRQDEVEKAYKQTVSYLKPNHKVTLLFNNAGIMPAKPFSQFKGGEILNLFEVNVMSQFYVLLKFLPQFLKDRSGHIVAMCSVAGVAPTPYLVPYSSTKFAIKGYMDALTLELHYLGLTDFNKSGSVRLTTVLPFTVNTGLAVNPTSRFKWLFPITEPDVAVEAIIDGVRRGRHEIYIPEICRPFFSFCSLLPRKVLFRGHKFLNCGVGYTSKTVGDEIKDD